MSYLVLARKYRPGTFDEVAGQPATAQTLKNAIRLGRVAHAYLFAGPRGVGKTSMARILARALCCVAGPTATPCGECDRCQSILRGNDLDVVEIDAASNRGIDDIRALREKARVAPMRGASKLYIIDEAHQLTSEAFNALLKTLEEPPRHVIFVLATTEPEKIPDTIRSRCQFFEFRRVPEAEIASRLEAICEQEGIEAERAALSAIARAARGGMRDSQSLLDQVITHGAGKVTEAGVLAVTGSLSPGVVAGLLRSVRDGDLTAILLEVDRLDRAGLAMEGIVDALLAAVRDLLVICATGGEPKLVERTSDRAELVDLAAGLDVDRVLAMTNMLLQVRRRVREHDEPRLPLEATLLRMARLAGTMSIGDALAVLQGAGRAPAGPAVSAGTSRGPAAQSSGPALPSDPGELLSRLASEVGRKHGALEAFLAQFRAERLLGTDLQVVPVGTGGGLYTLDDQKLRRIVADASSRLFGRVINIVGAPAPPVARSGPPADPPPASLVDRAREMFDGEVID